MRRSKLLSGFALPVVGVMLLASCGGGSSDDDGGSGDDTSGGGGGGSFSVAAAEPEAFAPTSACYSSDCSQVINSVFTPLLRVNPETNEQEMLMAESIDSPDAKVWTIKLKEGFTFHNGEPVDAQSFARAWNYAAYGPNATQVGFFFDKVEGYDDLQGKSPKAKELSGLKVVDDQTLEVTLDAPYSQFPLRLSYTAAGAPMAEECEQDIKACNEEPIGNGPYQFAEPWQHNQSITLEKYADYPQGEESGNADEIEFKIYADLKTAYRDLQSGNLDLIERVDPSQRAQAESTYPNNIAKIEDGYYGYFGFPFYVEDFSDVRVRQALSLAIDRETIIDRVLNGDYEPATDVLPSFIPGARDDACDYCEYDPERAKQLLEDAGGIEGDTVEIWFNSDGGHEQWVQAMAQGWKQDLGIDFELKSQLFDPYLETLGTQSKVQGPYRLAWSPTTRRPRTTSTRSTAPAAPTTASGRAPEHEKFIDLVNEGNQADTPEAASRSTRRQLTSCSTTWWSSRCGTAPRSRCGATASTT